MKKLLLLTLLALLSVDAKTQSIGWSKSEIEDELVKDGYSYKYDFDGNGSMWIISYKQDLDSEYGYRIAAGDVLCDHIIINPRTEKGYFGYLFALNGSDEFVRISEDVWYSEKGLIVVKGITNGRRWFSITDDH